MGKTVIQKSSLVEIMKNYGLLLGMAIFSLTVALIEPKFLQSNNILNIMRQTSVLGVVSLGMTIVIIGGYIDLSISGLISLVAVVVISLQHVMGSWLPIGIGLLLGALVGLINAGIILFIKAGNGEALVMTFGTQLLLQAAALIYSKGFSVKAPDNSGFRMIGQGRIGFLAVSIVIFLSLALILHFVMSKTRSGRSIYLIGGNKTAAILCGIPANLYVCVMYILTGLLAAAGAIILTSRTMSATPTMGTGYEMNAIMAVVIGGTSLKGGQGSVVKTILGVILVGVMNNAMNILGVTSYLQGVVQGPIIMLAVLLDGLKNKQGE
jgi:ribose/xylose/arabinose/galactoside ABC-type transport system permease subunit